MNHRIEKEASRSGVTVGGVPDLRRTRAIICRHQKQRVHPQTESKRPIYRINFLKSYAKTLCESTPGVVFIAFVGLSSITQQTQCIQQTKNGCCRPNNASRVALWANRWRPPGLQGIDISVWSAAAAFVSVRSSLSFSGIRTRHRRSNPYHLHPPSAGSSCGLPDPKLTVRLKN